MSKINMSKITINNNFNKIIKPKENARKTRGKIQKIFLILTHEFTEDCLERAYDVMGTTGNVYTVVINERPTCTCPDFTTRYNRCKHIYFVLTRIMKVDPSQEDNKEYDENNLETMFKNIPQITNNLKVSTDQVVRYKQLRKNKNGEVKQQKITDDTQCPVCLGELDDNDEDEVIIYCKFTCGGNIHKECFEMFNSKQLKPKCLICQNPWICEYKSQYINIE